MRRVGDQRVEKPSKENLEMNVLKAHSRHEIELEITMVEKCRVLL